MLATLLALCAVLSSCAYRYETQELVDAAPPPVAQSSFMYDAKGRQILLLRAPENRIYKQRNVIDYSGDVVSLSMANQAVVHAETLLLHTGTWIRANKPDLFP